MSRNNLIKIFIAVLVLVLAACSCFNSPVTTSPIQTSTVPANTICGWIENTSTTGAMSPTMTVYGTGQILQLYMLESDAIAKFNYVSPAYFRVYDPVYQNPDLLVNFSRIEQVPSCP